MEINIKILKININIKVMKNKKINNKLKFKKYIIKINIIKN